MTHLPWPGTVIDLERVGWLELQFLLPQAAWEAGIRLAQRDAVREIELTDGGGLRCTVEAQEVKITPAGAGCTCQAVGFCAHVGAALTVWIEERTAFAEAPEPAAARGALAGLPDVLTGIFHCGALRARIEIDEGERPDVLVDLVGEGGIRGSLRLPPEHLSDLLRMDAARIELGTRLEQARRPDAPLVPQIHAGYDENGAIVLDKRYQVNGAPPFSRDALERADLQGGWAWHAGALHPVQEPPAALRRAWHGPDRIEGPAAFEFVKSDLPALRRCAGFSAGGGLERAQVVRELQVAEVGVRRQGRSHWFYLEPRYSAGELCIALDELRAWSAEGLTRVRCGDLWIELPPAAELERIGKLFGEGNRVSAGGLLTLAAEWEGRVRVQASDATRELLDRLRGSAPPAPLEAPEGLCGALRGYQLEGYAWLELLAELRLGGILADEMGLGKTHQAMALLAARHARRPGRTSLVVCPRSVLDHWEAKLAAHAPALRVRTHHGARRNERPDAPADVWLTTYDTLVRDAQTVFAPRDWELLLLDEAQRAKNVRTRIARSLRTIDARAAFALTGTPIENSLGELWALFDLLLPGYLGSSQSFAARFGRPIEQHDDPVARIHLGRLVRPLILRRRKQQVAADLPEKIVDTRTCELAAQQELLYRQVLEQRTPSILENLADERRRIDYIHLLAALTRLKQICNHPAIVLSEAEQGPDPLALDCGKFELFADLLAEAIDGGQKVVVFSQYLTMLDLIGLHLQREKIPYVELRGSTTDRGGVIRRFQEDPRYRVFLASLLAAGLGIDLTAATVVIHYDRWWNAAREEQATDRVHRIGQTRGVQVFRLVTRGTIEERIDELIAHKASLAGGLIDSEVGALRRFTREELIGLLQAPASAAC